MNLSFLRPLFDQPGPWVSVYLEATRASENADQEVELRWRGLREQLTEQGADPADLDAIGTAIQEHPNQPGRYGLALFARGGEVVLLEVLATPPAADEAHFGPLPHTMPLVAQRGEEIPYVRVLADRTGAELEGLAVGGSPRSQEVTGSETFPLRKVHGGGWSHRRYLQAAEESWKRNAGDVATAAVELAESVGAEVIVVGGDVRAVQMFAGKLPKRWQERVVQTDAGSRHAGADESALDDVTLQAVADLADRRTRDAVERYQAQRGADSASTGLADVVTRLQRGQVDTVLLVNDPSSTDVLYIGLDDPTLVAANPELLRQSGVPDPRRVRADAALLRAIAGTSAELVLVERGQAPLEHGIGAVLRYADGSTAASRPADPAAGRSAPAGGGRASEGPASARRCEPARPGNPARMARVMTAQVAASSEWTDNDGVRQPAGEVHAWVPGTNQTLCGLALSRSRLRGFPHVRFDFRATDVLTAADQVRHVCPRCLAATGRRRERPWTRTSPRP